MMIQNASSNHLAGESSPYLLQHADNPVDWYPWGKTALQRAEREDKPILLSVGYSACHWCHVMAHESFEDAETARIMNERFINIKVDREERPDIDKIYQTVHSLLNNRSGGWPLTLFLDPVSRIPFFAGTYFPPSARHGLPAFRDILQRVADFFHEHRKEIGDHNQQLRNVLGELNQPDEPSAEQELSAMPLDLARRQIEQVFDGRYGGFEPAPKFPHPTYVNRLMRHWLSTALSGQADHRAMEIVASTLVHMADGGVFDHLGGGFFRYSVDEQWMIPHFEKMLYDNAALLAVYSSAWAISDNGLYYKVVEESAQWVMREMQAPAGGYYAALDADSEGQEGRYYTWTPDEVQEILSEQEYPLISERFALDRPANFDGRWHLYVARGLKELSDRHGMTRNAVLALVDPARSKLEQARRRRIRPHRDEKILTAWNGLMIKGMARAGLSLSQERYVDSARRAVDFIYDNMWRDGRLFSVHTDGKNRQPAYLDDHVFLIDGLLELMQVQWRTRDLKFALDLAEVVLLHFEDSENGGFFFTADDHEQLIMRPKIFADEAWPSGNGVAALVLARLAHLVGEQRYQEAAEKTLRSAWTAIRKIPYAHATLLEALEEFLYPPELIILRGEPEALAQWSARCRRFPAPRRLIFSIVGHEPGLPGLLEQRAARGPATAYICKGFTCLDPVTEADVLDRLLVENEVAPETDGAA